MTVDVTAAFIRSGRTAKELVALLLPKTLLLFGAAGKLDDVIATDWNKLLVLAFGWKSNEFWTGIALAEVDADVTEPNKDEAGNADVTGVVETPKAGKEGQDDEDAAVGTPLVMNLTADILTFWAAVVTLVVDIRLAPGCEKDRLVLDADGTVWVVLMPKPTAEEAAVLDTGRKLADWNSDDPLGDIEV